MSNVKIEMNEDTDYVHTAIINCEDLWLVLDDVCGRWVADQSNGIDEYRDELQDAVENDFAMAYLKAEDLTDDVDYAVMIQWEVENGD